MVRLTVRHVLAAVALGALIASSGMAVAKRGHRKPTPTSGTTRLVNVPNARLVATAVQQDGRIVAVGDNAGKPVRLLVIRLNKNGNVDRSFNGGRPVLGPVGSVAHAVVIQPDGKIVVAGSSTDTTGITPSGILVERLKAKGGLDRSFGAGGRASVLPGAARGEANGVALTRTGQIVVGGSTTGAHGFPESVFARFTSRGAMDRSFGKGGIALIDNGAYSVANAIGIQPSGTIIYAGSERNDLRSTLFLAGRLSPSGTPRGSALKQQFAHQAVFSSAFALALQSGGKVLVAGVAADSVKGSVALVVRLNGTGRPDGGFGSGGVVRLPAAQIPTQCCGEDRPPGADAIALSGKRIVAGGSYDTGGRERLALWGLHQNGSVDRGFGKAGQLLGPLTGANTEIRGMASQLGSGVVAVGLAAAPFTPTKGFIDLVG
jgi:uncharacterized delta-60 repeat protein